MNVAFVPPTRGMVGVVDDLLAGCPADGVRLAWADGACRISRRSATAEDAVTVAIARPVLRALIARIAVLCNEHIAGSVTPYGGIGVLAGPDVPFRAEFANTPSDQWLDLSRLAVA
jgi:hypothetical protein